MVLDPFCGCATACIAAEDLLRQWVGIDISPMAANLVQSRMQEETWHVFITAPIGLIFHTERTWERSNLTIHWKNKKYLYGETGRILQRVREPF